MKKCNYNKIFNVLSKKYNKKACYLHRLLRKSGIDFASGVPCGVLRHIIENLLNDSNVLHVPANRESEAVGIVAGAYLSGKTPIVYMQNSGLFASSNDIASFLIPYKIPVFFIITYRGYKGEDATQHLTTGKATEKLLDSFGLKYIVYENQNLEKMISKMFGWMEKSHLPVFLLLKRGWNL